MNQSTLFKKGQTASGLSQSTKVTTKVDQILSDIQEVDKVMGLSLRKAKEAVEFDIPNTLKQSTSQNNAITHFDSLDQSKKALDKIDEDYKSLTKSKTGLNRGRERIYMLMDELTMNQSKKSELQQEKEKASNLDDEDFFAMIENEMNKLNERDGQVQNEIDVLSDKLSILGKEVNQKYNMTNSHLNQLLDKMDILQTQSVVMVKKSTIQEAKKREIEAQKLDLCILIDCTGSMGIYIKMIKSKLKEILESLKKTFEDMEYRIAIVGYRDIPPEGKTSHTARFEILPFCEDMEKVLAFLNDLRTLSGYDFAEDVNGGFQKALYELDWQSATRSIIHVADAPCHGKKYHSVKFENDNYPDGYKEDIPYEQIFGEIKSKGINYLFLKVDISTDVMIREFKRIFESIKEDQNRFAIATSSFEEQLIKDSPEEMFVNIFASLHKSMSKSITNSIRSMTRSSQLTKRKALDIQLSHIEEGKEREFSFRGGSFSEESFIFNNQVEVTLNYLTNEGPLQDIVSDKYKITYQKAILTTNPAPFAQDDIAKLYECTIQPEGFNMPFKMVLKSLNEKKDKDYYTLAMKRNLISEFTVNAYNRALHLAGCPPSYKLFMNKTIVAVYHQSYYLLEPFIEGKFESYSSSSGYVYENTEILAALSHFSNNFTEQCYLLTDFKGVNKLLSNAQVHSIKMEFEDHGDKGVNGMVAYFRSHQCNEICQKLMLELNEAQRMKNSSQVKLEALLILMSCLINVLISFVLQI